LESISDSGSSDLFGRSGKADDDLLQGVDEVTIGYYNYKNDIIDGLSLFTGKITNGNDGHIWELNGDSPPEGIITEFDKEAVTYPFNPQFKILVKDDATLKINRLTEGAKLDFSIVVDAKAAIDQTITF
jgi:hypothetical protein